MSIADALKTPPGSAPGSPGTGISRRQVWGLFWLVLAALFIWLVFADWPDWVKNILLSKKAFLSACLNGLTLAGLYFLVASGFTLVFGLMRNVNLAHGSLYLLGAYIGYEIADRTGYWLLGVLGAFLILSVVGLLMQVVVFRRLEGDDLRQTLVTIGISIIAADLMLAVWTGGTYQILIPDWLAGAIKLPIVTAVRSNGSNVHLIFTVVFAIGAGLAGLAGVIGGSALSVAPGEDVRYLLASLVVVIVGGMGSITGAAIGALIIGLAEQIGLVYFPTYGVVLTFVIMVVTLAIRPQGIMGKSQ